MAEPRPKFIDLPLHERMMEFGYLGEDAPFVAHVRCLFHMVREEKITEDIMEAAVSVAKLDQAAIRHGINNWNNWLGLNVSNPMPEMLNLCRQVFLQTLAISYGKQDYSDQAISHRKKILIHATQVADITHTLHQFDTQIIPPPSDVK